MAQQSLARQLYTARTPQQRAAATRRLNNYLHQQMLSGYNPKTVYGAIQAHITMLRKKAAVQ